MHQTLAKCGDTLTHDNVMKAGRTNFQKLRVPAAAAGPSPSAPARPNYYPIQAVQLQRFKGETWDLVRRRPCRP